MRFIHSFIKNVKRLGSNRAFLDILSEDLFSQKGLRTIL